jgi:hypothetical protein
VEKQLSKLDDPTLDPNIDKEAMLGKPNDAKLDPKSNCTFAKGKEPRKKSLYLKFGCFQRQHCVEHKLFCAQTN